MIDISLQAVEGAALTGQLVDALAAGDGVDANNVAFSNAFPYVALPNGTAVNASLIAGGSHPAGVAVDGQYIYWTNTNSDSLGRAKLNGTHVNQKFITGAKGPGGLAVWTP